MVSKKVMINRIWVGALIFLSFLGMVALNIYFPNYAYSPNPTQIISGRAINSIIISALILLSVIEMRRALGKDKIPDCFSWLLWAYGFGLGPAYSLFGYTGILFYTLLVFLGAVVTSLIHDRVDSLIYIAFMFVYPGLFMATLLYLNRAAASRTVTTDLMYPFMESDIWSFLTPDHAVGNLLPLNGIALALVFAVSTFTDSFAFFVGVLFGKHQLCPNISPKKTIDGSIGGIVGGAFGSALIYFLFDFFGIFGPQFGLTFDGLGLSTAHIVLTYVLIGLGGSVVTQIGDLIASQVKRFCGIKDYSRILGEHGGIMDRFDGIMLNAVFVSFVFMFIF